MSLSVPLSLLKGRIRNATANAAEETSDSSVYPEPESFRPITDESISLHIGLIQPYLRTKLLENGGSFIPESNEIFGIEKGQKPKLAPSGKIITPRKRQPVGISNPQSAAKKKKVGIIAPNFQLDAINMPSGSATVSVNGNSLAVVDEAGDGDLKLSDNESDS